MKGLFGRRIFLFVFKTIWKQFSKNWNWNWFLDNRFYFICVWLPLLRTIFKILEKKCLGDHFYFWDKKKKVYKKDNDKEIEIMYFFLIYNDKFQIWNVRFFFFFGDKDKFRNLRDRRVRTNLWGPLFSI